MTALRRLHLPLVSACLLLSACASWNPFARNSATPTADEATEAELASTAPTMTGASHSGAPLFFDTPGHESINQTLGYSSAVRAGHWIIVSGQVGMDPVTGDVPRDFHQQVRVAFGNLRAALREAGATLSQVVEIQTYQLDMRKFGDVVRIRQEVFGKHRPAWTSLGVRALADPQLHFEVRAIAYAPPAP